VRWQTLPVLPRRLLLVRHAQAADGRVDAHRPLTTRGGRQAAALGSWLRQAGLTPDGVLVSPARRAAQTWDLASVPLAPAVPPIVDTRIYDNTVEALLAAIREIPDDVETLTVVGHNPSIGELAAVLDDGQGSVAARGHIQAGFPTGSVAVFDLATPFDEIAPGTATLRAFTVPDD
jgi:phosphohistidine phosphatase